VLLGVVNLAAGLLILAVAADQFVKSSARIAVHYRVSPVVVGAVLIGFGTSAPEMVVSGVAAAEGELGIGVGNIIGSNVANVSLVLAAATLVGVVPVDSRTVRREIPISVASVVVFALLVQGRIERWEGGLLAVLIAWFLYDTIRTSSADRQLDDEIAGAVGSAPIRHRLEFLRAGGGLVFVIASSVLVVDGATRISVALDLSGGFVGFTLVALGTSAPELATSVQAVRNGEPDLLVGNLLGSNIFNSLAVGAIIGLVGPGQIPDSKLGDIGAVLMVVIVVTSAVFMVHRSQVGRAKGIILFSMWVATVVAVSGEQQIDGALSVGAGL